MELCKCIGNNNDRLVSYDHSFRYFLGNRIMQVPPLRFTDSLMDQVSDSCYKYTELFAVPNVELNVDSIYEVTVY